MIVAVLVIGSAGLYYFSQKKPDKPTLDDLKKAIESAAQSKVVNIAFPATSTAATSSIQVLKLKSKVQNLSVDGIKNCGLAVLSSSPNKSTDSVSLCLINNLANNCAPAQMTMNYPVEIIGGYITPYLNCNEDPLCKTGIDTGTKYKLLSNSDNLVEYKTISRTLAISGGSFDSCLIRFEDSVNKSNYSSITLKNFLNFAVSDSITYQDFFKEFKASDLANYPAGSPTNFIEMFITTFGICPITPNLKCLGNLK